MKRLIVSLILGIMLAGNLAAMEPQKHQKITLTSEKGDYTLPREHALLSETLKGMIEDAGTENIPVPPALIETFDTLIPYFELAFQFKNNPESNAYSEIVEKLAQQNEQQLIDIIAGLNYLDIDHAILAAAIVGLREKLIQPDRIRRCLREGSYHLQKKLPNDMQREIAQAMMLKQATDSSFPDIKNSWLTQASCPTTPSKKISAHATVTAVCFNHDGTILASGPAANDNGIRLWNPRTRTQIGNPLIGHTRPISSLCFNHDGTILASAAHDNTIRLWNPRTGQQIGNPLTGHTLTPTSICFNHDGTLLASSSNDNTIRFWNPTTGTQIGNPINLGPVHVSNAGIKSICFNHNGSMLASGTFDGLIQFWNPITRQRAANSIATNWRGALTVIRFNHDSSMIASAGYGGTIRLWNPLTGAQIGNELTGHTDPIMEICFNHDGTLLASVSHDNMVRIWNPLTCTQIGNPLMAHVGGRFGRAFSVCFNHDGTLLASGAGDATIRLFAAPNIEALKKWFAAEIKPEQVALLLHAMQNRPVDIQAFPGINKITLPADLQKLINPSAVNNMVSRWNAFHTSANFKIDTAAFIWHIITREAIPQIWGQLSMPKRIGVATAATVATAVTAWTSYKIAYALWKRIRK